MADVKDTVERLRELLTIVRYRLGCGTLETMQRDACFEEAETLLTELERRARIERRLEKWLRAGTDYRRVVYVIDGDRRVVELHTWNQPCGDWDKVSGGCAADYWTAADAALDAAGAPKESD